LAPGLRNWADAAIEAADDADKPLGLAEKHLALQAAAKVLAAAQGRASERRLALAAASALQPIPRLGLAREHEQDPDRL